MSFGSLALLVEEAFRGHGDTHDSPVELVRRGLVECKNHPSLPLRICSLPFPEAKHHRPLREKYGEVVDKALLTRGAHHLCAFVAHGDRLYVALSQESWHLLLLALRHKVLPVEDMGNEAETTVVYKKRKTSSTKPMVEGERLEKILQTSLQKPKLHFSREGIYGDVEEFGPKLHFDWAYLRYRDFATQKGLEPVGREYFQFWVECRCTIDDSLEVPIDIFN